jgi:hypothetical protein
LYGAVQLTTIPPVTESIVVVTAAGFAGSVAAYMLTILLKVDHPITFFDLTLNL